MSLVPGGPSTSTTCLSSEVILLISRVRAPYTMSQLCCKYDAEVNAIRNILLDALIHQRSVFGCYTDLEDVYSEPYPTELRSCCYEDVPEADEFR